MPTIVRDVFPIVARERERERGRESGSSATPSSRSFLVSDYDRVLCAVDDDLYTAELTALQQLHNMHLNLGQGSDAKILS